MVGGAGFLGTSLIETLRKTGRRIVVIDTAERIERQIGSYNFVDIEYREIPDKLNIPAIALEECNTVFHLAWDSIPSTSMAHFCGEIDTNIRGSVRLFETAKATGIERVFFFSSGGAVYGGDHKKPISEDIATQPISAYGVGKASVEQFFSLFVKAGAFTGLIFRLSNPYGKYQLRGTPVGAIANFVRKAKTGEHIKIWGDGEVARDYIHVIDVAAAVSKALESKSLASGIYNLGSGNATTLNKIIELVEQVSNQTLTVNYTTPREFDVPWAVVDNSRLSTSLGWLPQVTIEEGITIMWESMCDNDQAE